MKSRQLVLAMACLILVAGDDPKASDGKPLPLFDGKSLEGWKKADFSQPGEVKVEDGAIVMGVGKPMTGVTYSRGKLPKVNYELSFEAKRTEGRDFFAAATFPVGDAFITLVGGGWGGSVTGLSSLNGSDASENDTSTYVKYENNKWYRFRVWVGKDVIRAWVDDKPVIDADIRGREVKTRIEVRANQPLGFATWESAGAVRKIEVRSLTETERAKLVPKEE
jgi:hypothetical protein